MWVLDGFLCSSKQCQMTFVQWLLDISWSTCFCVFQSNFFAMSKIFLYIVTSFLAPVEKPGIGFDGDCRKHRTGCFPSNLWQDWLCELATWAAVAGRMARALSPSMAIQAPLLSLLTLPLPLGYRIICVFSNIRMDLWVDQNVNDNIFLRKYSFWLA